MTTSVATLVHPLLALRVASEPAWLVAPDGRTAALFDKAAQLERDLRKRAAELASALELSLPALNADPLARMLLQAKRDVYNLRGIASAKCSRLAAVLPPEHGAALAHFNEDIARLHALRATLPEAYQDELVEGHAALRRAALRRNLNLGISYTKPELQDELQRFFVLGTHTGDAKKRRNLEDTLMQYVLRCSTKVSPLSSFTLVQLNPWKEGGADLEVAYDGRFESRVEFKSALARQLLQPLLADYARARGAWKLRLNPSLRLESNRVLWRSVAPGSLVTGRTYGTGESQTEIRINGAIQCILYIFAKSDYTSLQADALIAAICTLAPKLTADVVESVLRQLFELGALLPDTGFHEQQNPIDTLAAALAALDGEVAAQQRVLLNALAVGMEAFPHVDAAGRGTIVGTVRRQVAHLAESLGSAPSTKIAHPSFFENCYLHAPTQAPGWHAMAPFHEDLSLLLELAPLLDANQKVRSDMADAFLFQFGRNGRCTDVESFVRRFDEHYRPGRFFGPAPADAQDQRSEITRRQIQAVEAFLALLGVALRGGIDVSLDRGELRAIVGMLPSEVRQRSASHSFLGQICRKGGRAKFVVNQMLGGRSSMLSRFLESVDDAALDQVRRYLAAGSTHGHYATISGVFGFNANRHPRLGDLELTIPPFANAWPDTAKLPLEKLSATYDPARHAVCFHDADGVPLDLWYLGFLIPSLLPPVQRVLALAAMDGHINFAFTVVVGSRAIGADKVSLLPRISLGDLVLLRRTHVVPTGFQPAADATPFDFFRAVQSWREEHGLPVEFFARHLPLDTDPAANESWWDLNPKEMKPFYVRLDHPHLVRLMQRAMKKNHLPLFLAEALPALDDQHIKVAGEPHVAELQFELTRTTGAPDQSERGSAARADTVRA